MNISIEKLTGTQAKELLRQIVDKLDELDGEDFFGSEGWKHYFGMED
jgi:hypothetical protein